MVITHHLEMYASCQKKMWMVKYTVFKCLQEIAFGYGEEFFCLFKKTTEVQSKSKSFTWKNFNTVHIN